MGRRHATPPGLIRRSLARMFGHRSVLEYFTWGRHEVRRVYMKSRFEACCFGVIAFDIDLNAGE
ncbi:MAG: hypothetical protein RIS76_2727 [Verrucomicrobiota bacterium]